MCYHCSTKDPEPRDVPPFTDNKVLDQFFMIIRTPRCSSLHRQQGLGPVLYDHLLSVAQSILDSRC